MSHLCSECGLEHEPVVAVAEEAETETVTGAAVQIAEIEADRDVTLARIAAKAGEDEALTRIAALEGRLSGIQEVLDRLAPPEPEPVPVIVEPSTPEPEPVITEPVVESPAAVAEPIAAKTKTRNPWWG